MGNLKKFLAGLALSGAAITASASENPYIAGVESKQMASDTVAMMGGVVYAMAHKVDGMNQSLKSIGSEIGRDVTQIKDVDWKEMDKMLVQTYYAQRGKLNSFKSDQANGVKLTDEQKRETVLNSLDMYEKQTGQNMSFYKKDLKNKDETNVFNIVHQVDKDKEGKLAEQLKKYQKEDETNVFNIAHQVDKDKVSSEKLNSAEIVKRLGHSK